MQSPHMIRKKKERKNTLKASFYDARVLELTGCGTYLFGDSVRLSKSWWKLTFVFLTVTGDILRLDFDGNLMETLVELLWEEVWAREGFESILRVIDFGFLKLIEWNFTKKSICGKSDSLKINTLAIFIFMFFWGKHLTIYGTFPDFIFMRVKPKLHYWDCLIQLK